MHRKFKAYKFIHIDMLEFNPKQFIRDENGLPLSILFHKMGKDPNSQEILSWDEFLQRHIDLKEEDQENQSRATGWFVVFCCFVINVLVIGFFKSLGILLIEFRNEFNATPADVSLIVCLTYSLNSIAGPVACFMVVKYTPRAVALTGTIMVATGLILSYLATSTYHLCFTIGVLGGFGSGLTYSPGLILVANYFTKNRGLANGIVVSGCPCGGMVMPSVVTFFISLLGCRGALLIIGGFMLNSCICALAYHTPPVIEKTIVTIYDTTDSSSPAIGSVCDPQMQMSFNERHPHNIRRLSDDAEDTMDLLQYSTIYANTTSSQSIIEHRIEESYGRETRWKDEETKSAVKNVVRVPKIHFGSPSRFGERPWGPYKRPLRKPVQSTKNNQQNTIRNIFSRIKTSVTTPQNSRNTIKPRKAKKKMARVQPYVIALDHSCVILLSKQNLQGWRKKTNNSKRARKRKHKVPRTIVKDCSDNLYFEENGCDETDECETEDQEPDVAEPKRRKCSWCYNYWCKDNKYFSLSAIKIVLRNPLYVILLLSNATPAIGTTNVFLLIPSFARHLGMSRKQYSNIYLVVSLFDMVGRLSGTSLYDKGIFRPRTIYATGLLFAGLFSIFMGACQEYLMLISVSSVFGLATGLHIGIFGVLLQEIVGTEMLPAGYAFSMILNGILVLIGPYICGCLLSKNPGCYWPMYSIFGIILIVGALLWTIPLFAPKPKVVIENADDEDGDTSANISDES